MTLQFLTDHTAPVMRELDEWIVARWHEHHHELRVDLETRDHEDLRDDLEDLLSAARTPDVMTWFAGNRTRSLVDGGLMMDLAPWWTRSDLDATYPARFRQIAGGPRAYFLPTTHYWWAIYYRPSVFASVGISTPIETWDQLDVAARALRAAGITPFAMGAQHRCPAAAWFDYLTMRIHGPEVHAGLMASEISYTDPRISKVFETWRGLLEDGWFLGQPADYDEQVAVDAVMSGQAGMTLIGSYVADEYAPPGERDLDFFRFPVIDPGVRIGEDAPVDGYFVPGRTAQADHATAFLAHLGSREVQQKTIESMTVLPTRSDVDVDRAARHVAKGMRMLARADHVGQFFDLDTPWELADVGMDAFVQFLRTPQRAPELLEEVESKRRELNQS